MKSNLVYIAGPYHANTEDGIWTNIMAARDIAKQLWIKGFVPVVPHLNSMLMGGVVPRARFLEGDLEIIQAVAVTGGCILFTGNWVNSEGSMMEYQEACRIGMAIFHKVEDLLNARS